MKHEYSRADLLFSAQISAALLSATLSFISLRKAFNNGDFQHLAVRQEVRKYYWLALAIVVLLTIGIIIYFRMTSQQIREADQVDAENAALVAAKMDTTQAKLMPNPLIS